MALTERLAELKSGGVLGFGFRLARYVEYETCTRHGDDMLKSVGAVILVLAAAQQCLGKSSDESTSAAPSSHKRSDQTGAPAALGTFRQGAGESKATSVKSLVQRAQYCNSIVESEQALSLCNQAIAIDSSFIPAYLARYQAYTALERTADAINDLTRAARDKNYRSDALRDRAYLYIALKRYPEALADLNATMIGTATDGQYCERAQAYSALHKPDLAAKDLSEALKQKPHDYRILVIRAKAYLEAHQLDKALADYNELIKVEETNHDGVVNAQLYQDRATVLDLLGRKELAGMDRQRAKAMQRSTFESAPFRINDHH